MKSTKSTSVTSEPMTWDQVKKLARKIDSLQADAALLQEDINKVQERIESELKSWADFSQAISDGLCPAKQIPLADALQKSIGALTKQLEQLENQISRRKTKFKTLREVTTQHLKLLHDFASGSKK